MSLNGERIECNRYLPMIWHNISHLIFQKDWTFSGLCLCSIKKLKITSRKNQTGYLLFGLCVPNLFIHPLLPELFCVYYIWGTTRISGKNFSNVFPTIDTVQAWTQIHLTVILERVSRKTAACRSWNTISKTEISSNITVPPYIQEIAEKRPQLMMLGR